MTIALYEIKNLREYIEDKDFNDFICDIEEYSDGYMDVLDRMLDEVKHVLSEYLREAIQCGFDVEIMSQDYDIPEEFIGILSQYKKNEIDFKLRDYNILQNK